MQQTNDKKGRQSYPGAVPMVRIDGGKIRCLRESRGLTQLYLSSVVEVTTDTISRWENRRYQSIKLENAEKLAQALETTLENILDRNDGNEVPPPLQDKTGQETGPARLVPLKPLLLLAGGGILVLAAILLTFFLPAQQPGAPVIAERMLPPHVPPGQTFPVLIHLHSVTPETVSLIIREMIPTPCTVLGGYPVITSFDRKENSLKWIGRTEPDAPIHAYICQVSRTVSHGEPLVFKGTVTLKENGGDQDIRGAKSLTVAPYHWADTNRDYMIDDEEILAVYEQYADMKELDFDRDLIDAIWAGGGYAWDEEKKFYLVPE
jgi:transcriptional regulator with XRE-family HTH domain